MSVTVRRLLDPEHDLHLTVRAGESGLDRVIESDQIQKSGLAMTGYTKYIYAGWIQVLGNSEIAYLATLSDERRRDILTALCDVDIACVMVSRGLQVPAVLIDLCEARGIPLLSTPHITARLLARVQRVLASLMAPASSMHGVLIDVFGVGILLLGHSGIGKSECALDLVFRGHRLVADDIVDLVRRGDTLIGKGYDLIRHHMEIRGLGIINIKDLFGVAAVRDSKKVELIMELVDWDDDAEYDRLGIEDRTHSILGVDIPHMLIPCRPGRNVAVIVETAARNQLLKAQGHHSALEFQERLMSRISQPRPLRRTPEEVE
jgi:HPr kinase/phosphorylase